MNRSKALTLCFLLATISLTACSGLGNVCRTNCTGGGGTAALSLTLQAKPLALPPNTNILSYSVTIGGITLTPASGNAVNIQQTQTFDLVRLQSDSAFLGTFPTTLPAGTYTSLTVVFTGATVTYCTVTSGVPGCKASTVAQITGGGSAPVFTFANGGLVLTSDEKAGLSVDFNMGSTLTVANQVVSKVDLTAINLLTTVTLGPTHPSSLAANQLDYLEDITGNVSVTGNLVTIKTATHGSITATADSSTFYSPNCTLASIGNSTTTIACVQNNQVASIDAILNADGTIKLIVYDPLSAANTTTNDWIEGTVAYNPTLATQFTLVANDADVSSTGTLLPSTFPIGDTVIVNLAVGALFSVDTQGLLVPADYTNFQGNLAATALLPGQTVAVHVTAFAQVGNVITVTADRVELRFTRVAGTAASAGTNTGFFLTASTLPPFFGFTTQQELVQLTNGTPPTTNSTFFDGVTVPTNITNGLTYSIRALYFGQNNAEPFVAAKVRQNP